MLVRIASLWPQQLEEVLPSGQSMLKDPGPSLYIQSKFVAERSIVFGPISLRGNHSGYALNGRVLRSFGAGKCILVGGSIHTSNSG